MTKKTILLVAKLLSVLVAGTFVVPVLAQASSYDPSTIQENRTTARTNAVWSNDLFGTGEETVVEYDAIGRRDEARIRITSISTPDDVEYELEEEDDGEELELKFYSEDGKAELKIKARMRRGEVRVDFELEVDLDESEPAPLGEVEGAYTWTGQFCNGDEFRIDYNVSEVGIEITDVEGPAAQVEKLRRGRKILWANGSTGRIRLKNNDGLYRLKVDAVLGNCTEFLQPPVGEPTTTTTEAPVTTTEDSTTTVAPSTVAPSTTAAPGVTTVPATTVPATTATTQQTTTTEATTTTNAPTTTEAPATTTTVAPTTTTKPETPYLTYQTDVGLIHVKFDELGLMFWGIETTDPKMQWYVPEKYLDAGETSIQIKFEHIDTEAAYEFKVSHAAGSTTATFKSDGGTVTVAPPTESSVAPAKTGPSMVL